MSKLVEIIKIVEISNKKYFLFLENKNEIIKLYNEWYLNNEALSKKGVEEYLKIQEVKNEK